MQKKVTENNSVAECERCNNFLDLDGSCAICEYMIFQEFMNRFSELSDLINKNQKDEDILL
jgi:hypothetical protein